MAPRVQVVMKLAQLQNLVKRDPAAYKEEFTQQMRSYQAELKLFTMRPSRDAPRFAELVQFVGHVAACYPQECKDVPAQLISLLDESAPVMVPHVRKTIVQSLILMRNRGLLDVGVLLRLVFRLFRVQDKTLRETLYEYVVSDIRNINAKAKNDKLNKELQGFMYVMLKDEHSVAAKRSLEAMVELYRRRVWTDGRTVNVIASVCLSSSLRLMIMAIKFFLGIEQKMADDEEDVNEADAHKIEINTHSHSKKTRARERDTKRQARKRIKAIKEARDVAEGKKAPQPLFPALQVLHDPQGFADKMFKKLKACTERFDVKLLLMNFISRLIGTHKLLVLNFYSYAQRYLNSHQQQVTTILAYLVQACHDLVPPEDIVPVLKNVANAFVADRCPPEVIAVGINALREIIVRTPAVLHEPDMDGFVQDVSSYARNKDKSVMMAGRTFLNTVRELYPGLLQGKNRGKHHVKGARPAQYGETRVLEGVEGAELLQALEEGRIQVDDGEDEDEEEDSGMDEDEEGWRDMPQDSGEEEGVDDDDDDDGVMDGEDVDDDEGEEWEEEEDQEGEEEEGVVMDGSEEEEEEEAGMMAAMGEDEEEEEEEGEEGLMEVGAGGVQDDDDDDDDGDDDGDDDDDDGDDDEEEEEEEGEDEGEEEEREGVKRVVMDDDELPAAVVIEEDAITPTGDRGGGVSVGGGGGVAAAEAAAEGGDVEGDGVGGGGERKQRPMSRKRRREERKLAAERERQGKASALEQMLKVTDQTQRIDAQRVLTEEDFEKIRKLKAKFEEVKRDPRKLREGDNVVTLLKGKKRKKGGEDDDDEDDELSDDERELKLEGVVRPEDLEGLAKRRKASKEERLQRIVDAKTKFAPGGHSGGLTNLEKKRKKAFLMVRKGKKDVLGKLRDTIADQRRRKVRGVKSKYKHEARKRRRT